jgi:hypothetical protein
MNELIKGGQRLKCESAISDRSAVVVLGHLNLPTYLPTNLLPCLPTYRPPYLPP